MLHLTYLLLLGDKSFNPLNEWIKFVCLQKQYTSVWTHLHVVFHPVSRQTRISITFHTEFKLAVGFLYTQNRKAS